MSKGDFFFSLDNKGIHWSQYKEGGPKVCVCVCMEIEELGQLT